MNYILWNKSRPETNIRFESWDGKVKRVETPGWEWTLGRSVKEVLAWATSKNYAWTVRQ